MAHALDMSNGRANFAFVGAPAWHGLGSELEEGAPLERWQEVAGLKWDALELPSLYRFGDELREHDGRKVLVRSDTGAALANVSKDYQPVQPGEVLEFYRDLCDASGLFTLETAGALHGGRKVWALAKSKLELSIGSADIVLPYLFLATSFDGTMATTGKFTTVRVVCQNTLNIANRGAGAAVKVPHSTRFDPDAVKRELGLIEERAAGFERDAREMAAVELSPDDALDYFLEVLGREPGQIGGAPLELDALPKPRQRRIALAADAWLDGPGADLPGARGTLWGAVNAVTYLVDHEGTGRTPESRFSSAQFGPGERAKADAWALAGAVLDAARRPGAGMAPRELVAAE